jgi:leader peptidase (prepilin peptidase)/N-methyltransferase
MDGWPVEVWVVLSVVFLCIGSFLNVVGIRTVEGTSIFAPRSRCPACQTMLRPADLVPLLSFLWNRAKCRYCGKRISLLYPLGELATLGAGLLLVWNFGFSWELCVLLIAFWIGIAVSVSDVLVLLIPNKIIVPGILIIFILRLAYHPQGLSFYLLGALLGGGLLLLLALIYPQGMGMGDVKLFIMMGLVIGWTNALTALFFASFLGSVYGLLLLALKRRKQNDPVPFGPFIVTGCLLAVVWGSGPWTNYLNLTY